MKKFAIFLVISVLTTALEAADLEATKPLFNRFEVSAESGLASVLSGPEVKRNKNAEFRLGFYPSKEFELTLTYIQWKGELGRSDSLGVDFSKDFNRAIKTPVVGGPNDCAPRPLCYQVNFKDARLGPSKRDQRAELSQIEIGVVKAIPLGGKHWEAFVGVGAGVQKAHVQLGWENYIPPTNDPTLRPTFERTDTNEFFTAVRGGARYMPLSWLGAQVNFRWIPIAKMFGRDYNGVELNGGIVFRFAKF